MARQLGLNSNSSLTGDEDTLLLAWANEGIRDILVETHCTVHTLTMALTAGTADYTLDTDILAFEELQNDTATDQFDMRRVTAYEILRMRRAEASPPATRYSLRGANLLMLYPTPGSGESLNGIYVPKPTEMSVAANDPSADGFGGVPVQFHPVLRDYMLWRGGEYDSQQVSRNGGDFYQRYQLGVRMMKKHLSAMGGFERPRFIVNRRRRWDYRRSRNDYYP